MEKPITNKTKYPPESAGRNMTESVPLVHLDDTVADVKKQLFEKINTFETINYIYVVTKANKLSGVFSIRKIFGVPDTIKIKEIMKAEVIKARPYTDQERIAILALKNNLKSIPIVDKDEKFLGVVPSDSILEILHAENIEDILKLGGIPKIDTFPKNLIKIPATALAGSRLPWLIFGLFGGILAAQIISFFETPLKAHFVLAAFIPLMVYIAGAVGTQTQTLTVRNLAFDSEIPFKKYLLKEIEISFLIAFVLGILLSLIAVFWYQQPFYIGVILGISLFLTTITAIFIGFLVPYLFHQFKKDPALGSGPFVTIITDIVSLLIYFTVASLLLRIL